MQEENANSQLLKELHKTNKLLHKYVDLKRAFIRGILSGLGGFLGATIVLAILIGSVTWGLAKLQVVPVLGNLAIQVLEFVQENLPSETEFKVQSSQDQHIEEASIENHIQIPSLLE